MKQELSIDGLFLSLFINYGKTKKNYPKYKVKSKFFSYELLKIKFFNVLRK